MDLGGEQTPPSTAVKAATLTFTLPSSAGKYEFRLFANNTDTIVATSAPITVTTPSTPPPPPSTPPPSSTGKFPLRISSDRKYFVDQNGSPFLVVGDTAWSLPAQLYQTDMLRYLDDRKSRGFNAILSTSWTTFTRP